MAISALLAFVIPILLYFYFSRKKGADSAPFLVGCAVMFLFALVLESAIHNVVLLRTEVGKTIQDSIWLYALYGGLMAGLFEETGRFLAFKTVLRKYNGKDVNALMYGAGHAGIEAVFLLGFTMISNIALSVMINRGMTSSITASLSGDALAQIEASLDALRSSPPTTFLIGLLERVIAIALQIALSVIVWFGAKHARSWYLFPAAILIHAVVDGVTAVFVKSQASNLLIYSVLAVMTLLTIGLAVLVWKKHVPKKPAASEG